MRIYIKKTLMLPVKVYFTCIKVQQLSSRLIEYTNGDKQNRISPEIQAAS